MLHNHVVNLPRVSAFFGHLQTGIIKRHVGGLCIIVSNYIAVGMYNVYGNLSNYIAVVVMYNVYVNLSHCTKHG
jgi:hypothetical protein